VNRDERRVSDLLADLTDDDFHLDELPDGLWERIEASTAGPVTELAPARRRRWSTPALAAAAVVVAVVVIAAAALRAARPPGAELAEARLTSAGLARPSTLEGEARLVAVDGRQEIDLDVPDLPVGSGTFFELWLLAPDATRMQSLGTTDGHGRFAVPEGIDPHRYPVVDVSREPPDGNPAHSGDSLVRGRLDL
jgi:anti-sigma-K factor RskA